MLFHILKDLLMIKELQESFKYITYLDAKHQYFSSISGLELKSVTKFLNELKPHFDNEYWPL